MGVEIPDFLKTLAPIVVGQNWPQGDETALRNLGHAYADTGRQLGPVGQSVNAAVGQVVSGADQSASVDALRTLGQKLADGDESVLGVLEQACGQLDQLCQNAADEIEYTKYLIIGCLVMLAAQIAALIAGAIETLGTDLAAIPLAELAARATVQSLFRSLLSKLAEMGVSGVLRSLVGKILQNELFTMGLDAGIQGLQFAEGHRTSWDGDRTRQSAFLGVAGGIVGTAGELIPKGATGALADSAAGRLVDQGIRGGIRGGIEGAATVATAAALQGQLDQLSPDNLLLGAGAGAVGGTVGINREKPFGDIPRLMKDTPEIPGTADSVLDGPADEPSEAPSGSHPAEEPPADRQDPLAGTQDPPADRPDPAADHGDQTAQPSDQGRAADTERAPDPRPSTETVGQRQPIDDHPAGVERVRDQSPAPKEPVVQPSPVSVVDARADHLPAGTADTSVPAASDRPAAPVLSTDVPGQTHSAIGDAGTPTRHSAGGVHPGDRPVTGELTGSEPERTGRPVVNAEVPVRQDDVTWAAGHSAGERPAHDAIGHDHKPAPADGSHPRHDEYPRDAAGGPAGHSHDIPDRPLTDTGLASPETVDRYVQNMRHLQECWPMLNGRQRLRGLEDVINQHLAAHGIPPVRIEIDRDLAAHNGHFSYDKGVLNISVEDIESDSLGDFRKLGGVVYHEARHAEQFYLVARMLAGERLALREKDRTVREYIKYFTGIRSEGVLRSAVKNPLYCGSLEHVAAEHLHKSMYGSGSRYREELIRNRLPGATKDGNEARDRYEKNPSEENRADYQKAYESYREVYREYRNLPEEADAWAVQGMVDGAFGSAVPEPRDAVGHDARAGDRSDAEGPAGPDPQHVEPRSITGGQAPEPARHAPAMRIQPLTETGLAASDTFERYAEDMRRLQLHWSGLDVDDRVRRLTEIIGQQLAAHDIPPVEIRSDDELAAGGARFDRGHWAVDVSMDDVRSTEPADLRKLGGLVYREARHAEQLHLVARMLAGDRSAFGDTSEYVHRYVESATRIGSPEAVLSAVRNPLRPGSAEYDAAKKWYSGRAPGNDPLDADAKAVEAELGNAFGSTEIEKFDGKIDKLAENWDDLTNAEREQRLQDALNEIRRRRGLEPVTVQVQEPEAPNSTGGWLRDLGTAVALNSVSFTLNLTVAPGLEEGSIGQLGFLVAVNAIGGGLNGGFLAGWRNYYRISLSVGVGVTLGVVGWSAPQVIDGIKHLVRLLERKLHGESSPAPQPVPDRR